MQTLAMGFDTGADILPTPSSLPLMISIEFVVNHKLGDSEKYDEQWVMRNPPSAKPKENSSFWDVINPVMVCAGGYMARQQLCRERALVGNRLNVNQQ